MKKLKIMSLAVSSILVIGIFAGCGSKKNQTDSNATSTNKTAKKVKVGITYQNLQNEFIIHIQDKVRAKAKELNIELIEVDGQGKAENQVSQVENFITQKVDAIILNPFDKDGCAPAVDKAVAAKIPIVVLNAQVSNLDKANAYVGSDDSEAGKIEAKFIADKIGGKGNVVIIHGPNGHSAEIGRTKGNMEIIGQNLGMKVVAEQTANWDRAQALSLMENWLQSGKKINAVLAQNDEMALGAYKAIEAAGKTKEIPVIGIDAIPDALKSVQDGKLAATVFQDAGGQGATAVDLAVKLSKGEKVEHLTYIPFQLVTMDKVKDFLK